MLKTGVSSGDHLSHVPMFVHHFSKTYNSRHTVVETVKRDAHRIALYLVQVVLCQNYSFFYQLTQNTTQHVLKDCPHFMYKHCFKSQDSKSFWPFLFVFGFSIEDWILELKPFLDITPSYNVEIRYNMLQTSVDFYNFQCFCWEFIKKKG